jgi:hypothetical protein
MILRSCDPVVIHTYHYAVRSAPQLIARAYPHIARRTYTWIPPGEVSRLGPERAEGRKSVALISTLFRGSFEVNIVIFLEVGRVAGLPGTGA